MNSHALRKRRPLGAILMKHYIKILAFLFLIAVSNLTQAQVRLTDIKKLVINSDSVIVTSHYDQYSTVKEDGQYFFDKRLVIRNSINMTIVKEIKRLSDSSVLKLSNIISKPFSDREIERGLCFMPHHTIYIYKKSKISYLDICLMCGEFETSKDIKFRVKDFDQLTWTNLEEFLHSEGFTYGFD
jgi:hypothetical protein